MKNFTSLKCLITSAFVLSATLGFAQVTHNVNVSNFSFTPSNLNIDVGDRVVWNNTQGTHNVNGTTSTFPDNLASFGNSLQAAPWEFSFIFNVAGEYDYRCNPHFEFGMVGTVTVSTSTDISAIKSNSGINIYPQPVSESTFVELDDRYSEGTYRIMVYNVLGTEVFNDILNTNGLTLLNLGHLKPSVYVYRVMGDGGTVGSGILIKH